MVLQDRLVLPVGRCDFRNQDRVRIENRHRSRCYSLALMFVLMPTRYRCQYWTIVLLCAVWSRCALIELVFSSILNRSKAIVITQVNTSHSLIVNYFDYTVFGCVDRQRTRFYGTIDPFIVIVFWIEMTFGLNGLLLVFVFGVSQRGNWQMLNNGKPTEWWATWYQRTKLKSVVMVIL